MALYDSLFALMDCQAAQVLVTSNDFADADFRKNLSATTEDLLSMNVVPVFNENDAISSRTTAEVVSNSSSPHTFKLATLTACTLAELLLVMLPSWSSHLLAQLACDSSALHPSSFMGHLSCSKHVAEAGCCIHQKLSCISVSQSTIITAHYLVKSACLMATSHADEGSIQCLTVVSPCSIYALGSP